MAARAILAVTLLLTLVAGSIALPAAASGPMCTLTCCAGRAPHAAGFMHARVVSGRALRLQPKQQPTQSHHHHEQQPAPESDPAAPQAFAGVTASAGGSDMERCPPLKRLLMKPPRTTTDKPIRVKRGTERGEIGPPPCRQLFCRSRANLIVAPALPALPRRNVRAMPPRWPAPIKRSTYFLGKLAAGRQSRRR